MSGLVKRWVGGCWLWVKRWVGRWVRERLGWVRSWLAGLLSRSAYGVGAVGESWVTRW